MHGILMPMRRIGYVFGFVLLIVPPSANAASLYLDPSAKTVGLSETFVVSIRLDPQGDCVNAGKIEISYPAKNLKAVDFSRGNSIFSLWVEEPKIDVEHGLVTFSGGIPGGYCGRIPGDPSLTNVLGKIVFTVIDASAHSANVTISPDSKLYLNDGLGTAVVPEPHDATFTLQATPVSSENPWVKEVDADDTAPDAFDVQVESTRGVFSGKYYIVFTTIDKQSGIDHFEIFEDGGWKRISSPYKLTDQSLTGPIKVKAIDKAGNERLGDYAEGKAPPRQYEFGDFIPLYIVVLL